VEDPCASSGEKALFKLGSGATKAEFRWQFDGEGSYNH